MSKKRKASKPVVARKAKDNSIFKMDFDMYLTLYKGARRADEIERGVNTASGTGAWRDKRMDKKLSRQRGKREARQVQQGGD